MGEEIRSIELFNSPVEIGLRCLLIINSMPSVNLEELVILDYLCLNTRDFGGPESLHAPVPHRNVQILIRREMIKKGLRLLVAKELISVKHLKKGIYYRKTKLTHPFLGHLKSDYRVNYDSRLAWVIDNFGDWSEVKLRNFVSENIENWGGEITTESNYIN